MASTVAVVLMAEWIVRHLGAETGSLIDCRIPKERAHSQDSAWNGRYGRADATVDSDEVSVPLVAGVRITSSDSSPKRANSTELSDRPEAISVDSLAIARLLSMTTEYFCGIVEESIHNLKHVIQIVDFQPVMASNCILTEPPQPIGLIRPQPGCIINADS